MNIFYNQNNDKISNELFKTIKTIISQEELFSQYDNSNHRPSYPSLVYLDDLQLL